MDFGGGDCSEFEGGGFGGQEVLLSQARIGEYFSYKKTVPDYLKGRSIDDVANDLNSGEITPNMILIEAFEHEGSLVAINNRGLAALSLAGLRPTNLQIRQPTEDERDRLTEPTPLGDVLPARRIAVTISQNDWTLVDRYPNPIYIPWG